MSLPPWRSPLARALHHNRSLPSARYLQLATIDADQRPRNRTVVFRGFHPSTQQLQLITDLRSEKIVQLQAQPWVELCWYFPKSREQFRLTGTMELILHTESNENLRLIRSQLWSTISNKAKEQFYWPPPGQPRSSSPLDESIITEIKPPDSFCALLLDTRQVDYLSLKTPQTRQSFERVNEEWQVQDVNP